MCPGGIDPTYALLACSHLSNASDYSYRARVYVQGSPTLTSLDVGFY